jgi:hypothetical protein
MKVLLLFIDGLGLGANDQATNPLVRYDPVFFRQLLGQPLTQQAAPLMGDDVCLVATDACLGVVGLPQSATGQTTLFTGINAPQALGRHILGFPGPQLGKIIAEHGLMVELAKKGYLVTSANMYTPNYLEMVAKRKRRHSVTTLSALGAGVKLRYCHELPKDGAVFHDITNETLAGYGYENIHTVTPGEAGKVLADMADQHQFTLFEYFQTDRQGHKRDWNLAARILSILDEFLLAVHQNLSTDVLVILTSDHGNFEDMSVKTHTTNRVPTLVWGPGCRLVAQKIKDLTDIKPAILAYLEEGGLPG